MISRSGVVVLIATLSDRTTLLDRALASVAGQTTMPDVIVVVGDGTEVSRSILQQYSQLTGKLCCLINREPPGAANSWNAGIRFIAERYPTCYVAILDDDDEWDNNHLSLCLEIARQNEWPDVVISGLRMIQNGINQPREPVRAASVQDFLVGNPGWQGSNTFIRLSALLRAGCFTSGLQSCNDRDLAIRVLSQEGVHVAFTKQHTANWHLDNDRTCLSGKGSQTKLNGLAHFYHLHSHRMTADIEQRFFTRAATLFGWHREQIQKRAREHRDV